VRPNTRSPLPEAHQRSIRDQCLQDMAESPRRETGKDSSTKDGRQVKVFVFFLRSGTCQFSFKSHYITLLNPPQTRYETEEADNHKLSKKILLKNVDHKPKDIYDVTKGRAGFNESLPAEHVPPRVLPKPPSLSQLCVALLAVFHLFHSCSGTSTNAACVAVFLPLLRDSYRILSKTHPSM
jgi:hypothetical protein